MQVAMVGVFLMFRRERERRNVGENRGTNFLLPLFSTRPGEEERLQCRSKWYLFGLFLRE